MELLRHRGALAPSDSKSYRAHRFVVPTGTQALRIAFAYDRGGEMPHSLVTLSLFDPRGFRGAGHRFAPRQEIRVGPHEATPGFVAGAVPAGEWTVEVDVHCVIAPGGYELSVDGVDAGRPAAALLAAPEEPSRSGQGRRWLAGELHLHSTHSDGRWTVEEMGAAARGRGVDFLFLTDHNTTTGVAALRRVVGDAISVHPGQEMTTFRGHALALGPESWLDWRTGREGRTADDLARDVRAAGGVFVIAHPDAPPDEVCTGCRWTHPGFDPALADAVEVWGGLWDGAEERNEGCLALWRSWLDAGHRLAATGATDAHRHEDWHGPVPLTHVLADDLSLPSILDALRSGRTYVSSGPEIGLSVRGADGSTTDLGGVAMGAASIEAWCKGSPDAELRIVAGSQTRARSSVRGEGRLTVAPGALDRWCCAELWQGGILLAVTSPVYLR